MKVVRTLASRNADLPATKGEQMVFVEEIVARTPTKAIILTTKPGFRGTDRFVMPNKNYGTAMGAYAWADEVDPLEPSLGQSASTLDDYNRTVAQAALQSPYVSFGIMLALAGPLPSYISARAPKRIVAETALFNIAGETTTGKTCVAMAAASVTGNSNALIDWDTSMRGVAEASTSRNDLVLILDDTEKFPGNEAALRKMLHALVQKIPAGKSTTIAKKAQASGLPLLRWSTFGLSTSTSTLFSLLDLAKKPESGDRVRGLDIRVPKRSKGGIFGSRVTGTKNAPENSGEAIRRLESALQEHYGVLFPAWMDHLLGEDMSYEILGRVSSVSCCAMLRKTTLWSSGLQRSSGWSARLVSLQ